MCCWQETVNDWAKTQQEERQTHFLFACVFVYLWEDNNCCPKLRPHLHLGSCKHWFYRSHSHTYSRATAMLQLTLLQNSRHFSWWLRACCPSGVFLHKGWGGGGRRRSPAIFTAANKDGYPWTANAHAEFARRRRYRQTCREYTTNSEGVNK